MLIQSAIRQSGAPGGRARTARRSRSEHRRSRWPEAPAPDL